MSFSRNIDEGPSSTRKTWTIKMGASYLDGLLDGKIAFFKSRIIYWENELKEADDEAKRTRKTPHAVVVDDEGWHSGAHSAAKARASSCKYKLSDYRTKLLEAENWQTFFSTAGGGDEFQVTLEDALYFGLREYVKAHGA